MMAFILWTMPYPRRWRVKTSSSLDFALRLIAFFACALSLVMQSPRQESPTPIVSSKALEEVRHLRVSADNPVTSTNEHLDFKRCAALHNAIVKHAWEAGGQDPATIPARPLWNDDSIPQGARDRIHPDLIEYTKLCLSIHGWNFFHFSGALNPDANIWEWVEEEDPITLYITNDSSGLSGASILYDQTDHYCKFDGPCHDWVNPDLPTQWHRLETLLSFWIFLIERGKVVALHHSTENADSRRPSEVPLIDATTGARQQWTDQWPWTAVSYAKQDLVDTLDAWHDLIIIINEKMPKPRAQPFLRRGLFSRDTLVAAGIREDSFAWSFFTNAWKPTIDQIGPGLRLATDDHLINNPAASVPVHIGVEDDDIAFPIPFLVGSTTTKIWQRGTKVLDLQIPWGLYLDQTWVEQDFPMADSCRLALPYPLGANGLAVRADGSPLNSEHVQGQFELYQLGQHPFVPCHHTQLYMVLDAFARHVTDGLWRVGKDGVDEPEMVFQNADTEEGRDDYRVYIP